MSKLIPVCVFRDSTDLYEDYEMLNDNLTDLLFPENIVRAWYEARKDELDENTAYDLGVPKEKCTFELWYEKVSSAVDTDGLYDFAVGLGFKATRESSINQRFFLEELKTVLSAAVGGEYASRIASDDDFFSAVKRDVEETSAWRDEGYYGEDDVRLAVGRTIMWKFNIEY